MAQISIIDLNCRGETLLLISNQAVDLALPLYLLFALSVQQFKPQEN